MGFRVQGSGFRVVRFYQDMDAYMNDEADRHRIHDERTVLQGSGFRVLGLGFRVQGSGFRVQGLRFRAQGSGFRVEGAGW